MSSVGGKRFAREAEQNCRKARRRLSKRSGSYSRARWQRARYLIAPIVTLAGVSGWSVLIADRRQGCENGFPDQLCHFRAVVPGRKRRASGPWSLFRQSIETDYTHVDSVSVARPNFLDEMSATIRTDVLNERNPRNELKLPGNPGVAFPSAYRCNHQSPFRLNRDDRYSG
jgi:hypothetical protein